MSNPATVRTFPPDLFAPRNVEPTVTLPQYPAPERAKAVSILNDMARRNKAWLVKVRNVLASIYRARVAKWGEGHPMAYVCADDADHLVTTRPDLALPAGASPNVMGSVFRTAEWRAIDRTHVSSQSGSHGNLLTRWRYVGPERSDR